MEVTPNLGLTVWNLLTDSYDNSQLADNWARVDEHDHSDGKGKQIDGSTGILDGSITQNKLASAIISNHGIVTTQYYASSSQTTASVSYVALDTLTTGSRNWSGRPVLVQWSMRVSHSVVATPISSAIMIDDVATGYPATAQAPVANYGFIISGVQVLTPTAGAHTVAVGWIGAAATATCTHRTMVVTEL